MLSQFSLGHGDELSHSQSLLPVIYPEALIHVGNCKVLKACWVHKELNKRASSIQSPVVSDMFLDLFEAQTDEEGDPVVLDRDIFLLVSGVHLHSSECFELLLDSILGSDVLRVLVKPVPVKSD